MRIEKVLEKMVYNDDTFTKRLLFSEKNLLSFVLNLKSGQEIPPHKHENSDLILYVIKGGAKLTIDNKPHAIKEGDIIHCKGDEEFYLQNNTNDDFSSIVVLGPRPEPKIYAEEIK